MEKIILCRCFFGGYDFCGDCAGSGVIITHEQSDYMPISIAKQTILPNTPVVRTQLEKIKNKIKNDTDGFWAIIKNFKNLIPNKKEVISNLLDRVKFWKGRLVQIDNLELKSELENYIAKMQSEIRIVINEFDISINNTKKEESSPYKPITAWRRARNKRKK